MVRGVGRKTYLNLERGRFYGVGKYDMPLLRREDMGLPSRWIGFNEVNSYKGDCTSTGVHFFLDDYQFERVWQRPSVYVRSLRRFAVVATPDFSMYTDYPRTMQVWNQYRKQWLGAYWQSCGVHVWPTAAWSDADSYDWCFDGIPQGATVLVSAVGIGKSAAAVARFCAGYAAMMRRIKPAKVVAYGELPKGCAADEVIQTQSTDVRKRVEGR